MPILELLVGGAFAVLLMLHLVVGLVVPTRVWRGHPSIILGDFEDSDLIRR